MLTVLDKNEYYLKVVERSSNSLAIFITDSPIPSLLYILLPCSRCYKARHCIQSPKTQPVPTPAVKHEEWAQWPEKWTQWPERCSQ